MLYHDNRQHDASHQWNDAETAIPYDYMYCYPTDDSLQNHDHDHIGEFRDPYVIYERDQEYSRNDHSLSHASTSHGRNHGAEYTTQYRLRSIVNNNYQSTDPSAFNGTRKLLKKVVVNYNSKHRKGKLKENI